MAQAQISERLARRIRWLGAPDPTWTREDGRATTEWAVDQALAFLERITEAGLPYGSEPQITATARGGIEFLWRSGDGSEIDVVLPAGPGHPIEIAHVLQRADGSVEEHEREASSLNDAIAFIERSNP